VAGIVLQETFSVIGDPATAMRDPMFYRWHSFVDDMFQEHKATLPRYDTNRVSDRDRPQFMILIAALDHSTFWRVEASNNTVQNATSPYSSLSYTPQFIFNYFTNPYSTPGCTFGLSDNSVS
jgi:hypothetical protein